VPLFLEGAYGVGDDRGIMLSVYNGDVPDWPLPG
jgi:hypothetical protein